MIKKFTELKKFKSNFIGIGLILLEVILLFLLFSSFPSFVMGGIGGNVTVITQLTVGNVAPEVLNVSIDDGAASVTLIANSTKLVSCIALLRDWNNESDINTATAEFFDINASSYGDTNDNNEHYANSSCNITLNFSIWKGINDDEYLALANCSFSVQYYSNPGTWNCTVFVNDTSNWNNTNSDNITINELLAVGLPSTINYGTVNSTYVSNENMTSVINFGNIMLNLSLSGYAVTEGDNLSMNCTLGSLKNISIKYEKYNLTVSTPGSLTLSQFEAAYINLTSAPIVKRFDLNYRQNDTENEAFNSTYWRMYVPIGVAGSCSGNIVFGAVKASGS